MGKLISDTMSKFLPHNVENILIDGKTLCLEHEALFDDNERHLKFCLECLQFYVKFPVYLLNQFFLLMLV